MAMEIMKSGQMTICRVAKLYKIPTATLFKHVKGLREVKSQMCQPSALPSMKRKKLQSVLS